MARDSSGTMALVSGHPVVTNDTISATMFNATMNDFVSEFTDSLSRSGKGGMSAAFKLVDGSVSAPGVSFANETSSGLYRAGSGDVRVAVSGVEYIQLASSLITLSKSLRLALGAAVSLAGTTHSFQLGATAAANLAVSAAIVQARNNGAAAALGINSLGGAVTIGLTSSDGAIVTAAAGAVTLYHAGVSKWATTSTGFTTVGTLGEVSAGADSTTRFLARNTVGGIDLTALTSTGAGQIRQTDSSGTLEDVWIDMARNAGVTLYDNNVAEFKTQAHAASAVTSGAAVKDFGGTYRDVGFNVLVPTTYDSAQTLSRTHQSQFLKHTTGTHAWTTWASSDTDVPNGAVIMGKNAGGTLTVEAGSGVTLEWYDGSAIQTGTRTVAVGSVFTLTRESSTLVTIYGNGLS